MFPEVQFPSRQISLPLGQASVDLSPIELPLESRQEVGNR
jgi:hypothetical protein